MFAEEEMDFQNIALLLTATKRNTKKKIYTAATQLILFGLRSFSGTTFFVFEKDDWRKKNKMVLRVTQSY